MIMGILGRSEGRMEGKMQRVISCFLKFACVCVCVGGGISCYSFRNTTQSKRLHKQI